MTLQNDAKSEEKLTFLFESEMRNFTNIDPSTQMSQNLHSNGLLLTKVYDVSA